MKKLICLFILICVSTSDTFSKKANIFVLEGNGSLVINKLGSFIKEKKFQPDETLMYPGINSKNLKIKLTDLVNESARDFMQLTTNNAGEEEYLLKMRTGLERFDPYYSELSSEDLDRIYQYYEQLIQIVGLKDAGTYLKKWRYGSVPSGKKQ